jgi:hypothetical protein
MKWATLNHQPPSSTAVGITNNTVKRQHSRSMEMQFFWVADAVNQGKIDINISPEKKILQTTRVSTIQALTT